MAGPLSLTAMMDTPVSSNNPHGEVLVSGILEREYIWRPCLQSSDEIKMRSFRWAQIQSESLIRGLWTHRDIRSMCAQRKDHVRTRGGDRPLPAKEALPNETNLPTP